jgi:WD40 repeat protein
MDNGSDEEGGFLVFNQSRTSFAWVNRGYTIYVVHPFYVFIERIMADKLSLFSFLYQTNIFCYVLEKNRMEIIIWDDKEKKEIASIHSVAPVKALCMRNNHLIFCTESYVYIYGFPSLNFVTKYESTRNMRGLLKSSIKEKAVFAFPCGELGAINVVDFGVDRHIITIKAHQNAINNIELSADGDTVVTCSERGTVIRMYETSQGQLLREFQRSRSIADVYSMTISESRKYLVVASNKGTIHLYSLGIINNGWFSSREGSTKKIYLPPENHYHCCFTRDDKYLVIIGTHKVYYRCCIDNTEGDITVAFKSCS